jgi:tRNA A-37 threonylcarbamoyl transferase component Bud32
MKKHRERSRHFTEEELWMFAYELCLAVDYLHARQIIHRDIKSLNILLTKNKTIKVDPVFNLIVGRSWCFKNHVRSMCPARHMSRDSIVFESRTSKAEPLRLQSISSYSNSRLIYGQSAVVFSI